MARLSIIPVVAFVVALSAAAPAQAQLAPSDATDFMGVWTLVLESPQGPFEQELTLKDEEGKVVGVMTNQMQPEPQKITDVSKTGADLVLKFAGNFQGNPFDAKITVTPAGPGKATVAFDVNNGQFAMSGTGIKKP